MRFARLERHKRRPARLPLLFEIDTNAVNKVLYLSRRAQFFEYGELLASCFREWAHALKIPNSRPVRPPIYLKRNRVFVRDVPSGKPEAQELELVFRNLPEPEPVQRELDVDDHTPI